MNPQNIFNVFIIDIWSFAYFFCKNNFLLPPDVITFCTAVVLTPSMELLLTRSILVTTVYLLMTTSELRHTEICKLLLCKQSTVCFTYPNILVLLVISSS